MLRWGAALVSLSLLSACSNGGSVDTEPTESLAPTDAALAANERFLEVPNDLLDCGATVLTSGWPTTTVFNPEISSRCILDAAQAKEPAQYAYWGRDGTGGITGVVIRVNELSPITVVEYSVDAAGGLDSAEEPCAALETESLEPPQCASG